MNDLTPSSDVFTDVRGILADARRTAYTAVNSAMVAAYWQIGRRIVEEEQGGAAKAIYGEGLLKALHIAHCGIRQRLLPRNYSGPFGRG